MTCNDQTAYLIAPASSLWFIGFPVFCFDFVQALDSLSIRDESVVSNPGKGWYYKTFYGRY